MDLPAVGEHVFAVEGIEKKRVRKVKPNPQLRRVAVQMHVSFFFNPKCSNFVKFPGQSRVSGEVERVVTKVSPPFRIGMDCRQFDCYFLLKMLQHASVCMCECV